MLYSILSIIVILLWIYWATKRPWLALLTSPFVSIGLVVLYVEYEYIEGISISLCIVPATLITIVLAHYHDRRWGWLKMFFLVLLLIGFLGSFAGMIAISGPVGIYVPVLYIGIIFLLFRYYYSTRYMTTAGVISTIGTSMRQNLPLATALEAAAGERRDRQGRILREISRWLVQGYSLNEALKRGFPRCPGNILALISVAERVEQVPLAIRAIEADMLQKARKSQQITPLHPIYPFIVIAITFFVVSGLMYFVIPKYLKIFSDFEAPLPHATQFLVHLMKFVWETFHGWLVAAGGIAALFLIGIWIQVQVRPRRPERPYLVSRIGDLLKWHLPVLHWFEKNYSLVQVVEFLRPALQAGCTVDQAIQYTLDLDVNRHYRKRLAGWLKKVEQGADVAEAARQCKVGNALAWAFDTNVNEGNTPAVLEMLEGFYRTNYSYRANLARFIMWPCVTVLLGLMVGFVVYAMFIPTIALIEHVAGLAVP